MDTVLGFLFCGVFERYGSCVVIGEVETLAFVVDEHGVNGFLAVVLAVAWVGNVMLTVLALAWVGGVFGNVMPTVVALAWVGDGVGEVKPIVSAFARLVEGKCTAVLMGVVAILGKVEVSVCLLAG